MGWVGCGAGRGWRGSFPRDLSLSGRCSLTPPVRLVGFHPVLLYKAGGPPGPRQSVGISEGAKSWSGGVPHCDPWALLTPQSRCRWLLTPGHWFERHVLIQGLCAQAGPGRAPRLLSAGTRPRGRAVGTGIEQGASGGGPGCRWCPVPGCGPRSAGEPPAARASPEPWRCLGVAAGPERLPAPGLGLQCFTAPVRQVPPPSSGTGGETEALEGEGTPAAKQWQGWWASPWGRQAWPGGGGAPGCWDHISSSASERPAVRAGQAPVRAGQAPRWWLAAGVEAKTGLMSPFRALPALMKALGSGLGVLSDGAGGGQALGQVLGFEPQGVFSAVTAWGGGVCGGEGRSMSPEPPPRTATPGRGHPPKKDKPGKGEFPRQPRAVA